MMLAFAGCKTPIESVPVQSHNDQLQLSRVAAVFFLSDLIADGKLTSFATNEDVSLELDLSSDPPPRTVCPNTLVFIARIRSEQPRDEYWYSVSRTNRWSEWRVVKAWKEDEKGNTIGVDILPSEAAQRLVYQKMLNSKRFKNEMARLTPNQAAQATARKLADPGR